ncbi:hypothetical protein TeGR_g9034, partial [Tetraparma gracilis]
MASTHCTVRCNPDLSFCRLSPPLLSKLSPASSGGASSPRPQFLALELSRPADGAPPSPSVVTSFNGGVLSDETQPLIEVPPHVYRQLAPAGAGAEAGPPHRGSPLLPAIDIAVADPPLASRLELQPREVEDWEGVLANADFLEGELLESYSVLFEGQRVELKLPGNC